MKKMYKKIGIICILIHLIILSSILANPIKSSIIESINSVTKGGNDRQICVLPVFIKANSDFYDKHTGMVNLKEIKRLLRKLEFQMYARYGKDEVKSGLMNLSESKFKFDEFDLIYFKIKAYLICLENTLF
jgi:hypothetical protein